VSDDRLINEYGSSWWNVNWQGKLNAYVTSIVRHIERLKNSSGTCKCPDFPLIAKHDILAPHYTYPLTYPNPALTRHTRESL
jgi:hypothetical protein